MTLNLAFLSPKIVGAAVAGALPESCSVSILGEAQLDRRLQEAVWAAV